MKKYIFTCFILLAMLAPMSISFSNGVFELQRTHAQTGSQQFVNIEDDVSSDNGRELNRRGLTQDSDGIVRSDCDFTDVFCGVLNGLNWLMEVVAWVPIAISSMFVYIAALLLNLSILETIVNFSLHFSAVGGIDTAWGTFRDLANLFFIFGLLVIAIATILGLSSYGYKQRLATLIIVALIINFSMLFTTFIIDTSNIFALQFYKGIGGTEVSEGSLTGVATVLAEQLGVSGLWETDGLLQTLNAINYSTNGGVGIMFIYSIMTSIFFIITAFVFFFAAVMLITRAVGLILIAILSPVAFAAFVLPATKSWWNTWWEKLWQYAIFAPALMILLWVVVQVAGGVSDSIIGGNAGLLDAISENPEARSASIAAILNFIILISLILASIIIANKLSISGAKGTAKFAGKLSFGTLAAGGRQTFGRAFRYASKSDRLNQKAAEGGIGGFAARQTLKATRFGSEANYDLRSAPLSDKVLSSFGESVEVGKPQKGGYEAIIKKQVSDREKFANSLNLSDAGKAEEQSKKRREERNLRTAQDSVGTISGSISTMERRRDALKEQLQTADPAEANRIAQEIENTEFNIRNAREKLNEAEKKSEASQKEIEKLNKPLAERYADVLATEKIERLGIKVPQKNKEAAAKIRKGKSQSEKALDALFKQIEDREKEKKSDKDDSQEKDGGDKK